MKRINAVLLLSLILLVGCADSIPTDIPQPTATSTTGQVKGVIVTKSTVGATEVNLNPVELGDNGSYTLSIELLNERGMSTDVTSGVFLFENVIPGYYLITANIAGGMPRDIVDDQGDYILLQVKAGQVIDLGEISVEG